MQNFKKIFALLLTFVIILSASACGQNEPAGNDLPGTTEDISDGNLFDDGPIWDDEEPSDEQSSTTTTEPSTQKQETTTKSAQSTTSTTAKKEAPTEPEKITIAKAEYTYNSVKQIVYYPNNIKTSSKTYPQ